MSKAFVKDDGPSEEPLEDEDEAKLGSGARYITRPGFLKLQAERDHLWRVERPRITAEVTAAAAQGDRSENAEYQYGKRRLREIDRRLRYLGKLLARLTVVEPSPEQAGRVFFGATVTVEDEDGKRASYTIVGPDEFDSKLGRISIESPLARALVGKRVGDEATVMRPRGAAEVTVVAIRYESAP